MGEPRAAVDVGTNSVRLIVLDGAGERLAREMTITRLGYGVDRTGHLDDAALERTLDTIDRYRAIWTSCGVTPERVRIAATSAIRDASDRDRFFGDVRRIAGVEAEVLSGVEEAATSFAGAASAVPALRPTCVFDPGGGSTELIVGDEQGAVVGSFSMQLGCVRLTERFLHTDPPTAAEIAAARDDIGARLAEADQRLAAQGAAVAGCASLVGVAGTVTTLAGLYLDLPQYREEEIHGTLVPIGALHELSGRLLGLTSAERAALGPVDPGRADVIAAGALIVEAIVERYGFEELYVSEADILDGLVASIS